MDIMSKYCKAYPARLFRQFTYWQERTDDARTKDDVGGDGRFADDIILYLHDNLTVTHGVIRNAHVVFDQVTPEWREYCERVLNFPTDAICAEVVHADQ